jgi:hypothetical protein
MEHIIGPLVDPIQNIVSALQFIVVFEIMAPFWAIFDTHVD